MTKRIITGMKPTNKLHIGNYFGVIPTIKKLQEHSNNEIFLFSADLHALTTDTGILQESELVIKFFLSCLDCSNLTLYIQSDFPQITYCMWLMSCCTPMGYLDKMTQYKDQSKKNSMVNSGLFNYPLLMAADILMLDADYVPVGKDQIQHLELARDIANFFHSKYGASFTLPKPLLSEVPKIYDLKKRIKMSKSTEDEKGTLFFHDSDDHIKSKIQKATTDNESMPINIDAIEETRPFIFNLCKIYSLMTNKTHKELEEEFGNKPISSFKQDFIDVAVEFIRPIREKMKSLCSEDVRRSVNKERVNEILDKKLDYIKSSIFAYKS